MRSTKVYRHWTLLISEVLVKRWTSNPQPPLQPQPLLELLSQILVEGQARGVFDNCDIDVSDESDELPETHCCCRLSCLLVLVSHPGNGHLNAFTPVCIL